MSAPRLKYLWIGFFGLVDGFWEGSGLQYFNFGCSEERNDPRCRPVALFCAGWVRPQAGARSIELLDRLLWVWQLVERAYE